MIPINKEILKDLCEEYTKRTGVSVAELSRRIAFSKNIISNATYSGRISEAYVDKLCEALGYAGIDARTIFVSATGPIQELQKAPQEANESEIRGGDQDLRKEVQRLRDDLADIGVLINALREERQRDEDKLLQAITRLTEAQLTQRQIGEEIVSGIILAMGQINIDEPTRSAYAAIRKAVRADIYRGVKGELK